MKTENKTRKSSYLLETLIRLEKNNNAKIGTILLLLMVFCCVFAPLVAPYSPSEMNFESMYATPSLKHLCGCDNLGRDIFSRLLYGGRYSLFLGLASSVLGTMLGIFLGSIAGYFGGKVESFIMRIMDIYSAIPGMLMCILISTAFGNGYFNTIFALSISQIPGGVRMTRAQILKERSMEYLEAAESINCSKMKIMFSHLLPNIYSPMLVGCTMGIGSNIMLAATLSYIGLGIQPPTPEWGAMLSDGRAYILDYPHMILFPGLFIAITVFSINLLGDALRDALDPKLRR